MSNKLPLRWIIHFHLVGKARGGEILVVFWKLNKASFVVYETYIKATKNLKKKRMTRFSCLCEQAFCRMNHFYDAV